VAGAKKKGVKQGRRDKQQVGELENREQDFFLARTGVDSISFITPPSL
jgi:hypothetical protein